MKNKRKSYIRKFVGMFKPYKRLFALVIVLTIAHQTMGLAYPWLARIVMDEVIAGNSGLSIPERQRVLQLIGGSLLALALGIGVAGFFRGNLLGKLLWRIIFDLRQRLNWHLQKLSLSFFSRQQTGRLVSRLISDINQASKLISQGAVRLFLDSAFVIAVIVILWRMNPLLMCLSLVFIPVYIVAFRKLSPRIRAASKDVQRHVALMSGNAQERFSGMSLIQSFSSEEIEHEQFTEDNQTYTRKVLERRNLSLFLNATTVTVNHLSNGVILVAGGALALAGKLSPGEVLAFILYLTQLYTPLQRLAEINIQIQQAFGSLERVFEILEITPEIRNAHDAVKSVTGRGQLKFENVSFCYEEGRQVLRGIDLNILPGEKVAVIGPSGAGKSTLASLVPRLYDVTEGRILLDSTDIRKIDLGALRRSIGIVQQEPFLFSTTIKENINYGRWEGTMEEIRQAAATANADEFIGRLPDGYDSVVGERGLNLSGGERQRICLARTILKDPNILILDEATSSLDSEAENLVQGAMERLLKGRSTVIIAHRLSTIMNADKVIVLDRGEIVERGTHSDLWNKGGLYAHLLEQQFGPLQDLVERASGGDLRRRAA